mmetsp:Transcript_5349/g.17418  ORF Transcript_5349/g.17418 Transcript_5349/m.17418 type:complete len:206 (-) Transcript_5349:1318-1935(-)
MSSHRPTHVVQKRSAVYMGGMSTQYGWKASSMEGPPISACRRCHKSCKGTARWPSDSLTNFHCRGALFEDIPPTVIESTVDYQVGTAANSCSPEEVRTEHGRDVDAVRSESLLDGGAAYLGVQTLPQVVAATVGAIARAGEHLADEPEAKGLALHASDVHDQAAVVAPEVLYVQIPRPHALEADDARHLALEQQVDHGLVVKALG